MIVTQALAHFWGIWTLSSQVFTPRDFSVITKYWSQSCRSGPSAGTVASKIFKMGG